MLPSNGEIDEVCYDFEVNQPIDGQRVVIELGKAEGKIALCAASLRRCSSISDIDTTGEDNNQNPEGPITHSHHHPNFPNINPC